MISYGTRHAMNNLDVVPRREHFTTPLPAPVVPIPRDHQIAQAYRSGKTMAAVGAMFGITRERVRQILAAAGVPSRRGPRFPSALGDQVARLYQRGDTIEAAARAVGVSAFTARNMLVERGIERRPGVSAAYRRASTRRRHEALVRLYKQGLTFKELAKAFETSTTSVQRVLKQLGIERRGRGRPSTAPGDEVRRVERPAAEGVPVEA